VIERKGSCFCGQITFVARGEPKQTVACSCTDCQRRSGTAFTNGLWFEKGNVSLSTTDFTRFRHHNDKARWIEHGFCQKCGTAFMWEAEAFPGLIALAGGSFVEPNFPLTPDYFVYKKSLPKWAYFRATDS